MSTSAKKLCTGIKYTGTKMQEQLKELVTTFNQRITGLEHKLSAMMSCCNTILAETKMIVQNDNGNKHSLVHKKEKNCCCNIVLKKMSDFEFLLKSLADKFENTSTVGSSKNELISDHQQQMSPIVLLPTNKPAPQGEGQSGPEPSIQIITLNNESDHPYGCWLGDESNPEARVRVSISPAQLLYINALCLTPEKMAITLLDYLFPREVLAVSNLSGKGKHGKKQLDPLLIYAIRAHLMHRFKISETDWHRIKQNIDSKCRTVWQKKVKGQPLGGIKSLHQANAVKSECGILQNYSIVVPDELGSDDSLEDETEEVIQTSRGQYKVLRATAQTLSRFQGHPIKIYSDDELAEMVPVSALKIVPRMACFRVHGAIKVLIRELG